MNRICILFLLAFSISPLAAQERMSPELLWRLGRVGGGSLSPDGEWVMYSVRRYELKANKGDSDLYVVAVNGDETRRITSGPTSEGAAQWVSTKKGPRVFFTSRRGEDTSSQVWSLDPASGDLMKVTDVAGGVANLKVAPTGDRIAFTSNVKLDPTVADLHPDLPLADARIIDDLLYRHWDTWHDYAYSHLGNFGISHHFSVDLSPLTKRKPTDAWRRGGGR